MANRDGKGHFLKGVPRHPNAGRRKGSVNVVLRNARDFAISCVNDPDYQEKLIARLQAGRAGRMEELLWYYAHGKPPEHIELTGKDGGAIEVQEVERVGEQFAGRILRLVANGPPRAGDGGNGADGQGGP